MTDMISMAIELHLGSIFLILAIIVWILLLLKSAKPFKELSKKYEAVSLYYRALLGILFFTGLVVVAVAKFHVSWMVIMMVVVVGYMLVTSVKENILYKKTHLKNNESQEVFKKYAIKKYSIDFIMIVLTAVVSYAVSL